MTNSDKVAIPLPTEGHFFLVSLCQEKPRQGKREWHISCTCLKLSTKATDSKIVPTIEAHLVAENALTHPRHPARKLRE